MDDYWRIQKILSFSGRESYNARPELERAIRARSVEVREVAAFVLGGFKGDWVEDILLRAAIDKAAAVRQAAVASLARIGSPRAIGAVGGILAADRSPDVRAAAAFSLGYHGRRAAAQYLVAALGDTSCDVRAEVIRALARIGHREAAPAITALLEDKEWFVRAVAAAALGDLNAGEARQALEKALDDASESVVAAAYDSLARLTK